MAADSTERDIALALRQHQRATAALHELIRQAHAKGWSLRRISEVAGVSHEQVRRITSR